MKKFTVCLLIGAMAASMLTGCGSNGGSSDSSDSKADSSSETMTIMMNGSDSDAYMEGYRKIIDGFNESNEYGVKVEIQNVTNSDYKTKLTTMMASDSETDIIFTWELGYLENFVNGDKIVSLQKYLDEDEEWKNSFNGGILDPLTYDGEVYAIPTQQSTAIMYYNKAIFDKYGLEVPTTYDEYVQVCDTLKENGVTPVALASTADDAWLVSQYIQQLSDGIKGEDLFNSIKGGTGKWNDEGMVEAGKLFQEEVNKGYFEAENDRLYALKDRFIQGVTRIEDVRINGLMGRDSAPHVVSVSIGGIRSEVLLHSLEDRGICVSAGSACSAHKATTSSTLQAIGVEKKYLDSTLRFSFSVFTTQEEIDYTLQQMYDMIPMLRRYTRH